MTGIKQVFFLLSLILSVSSSATNSDVQNDASEDNLWDFHVCDQSSMLDEHLGPEPCQPQPVALVSIDGVLILSGLISSHKTENKLPILGEAPVTCACNQPWYEACQRGEPKWWLYPHYEVSLCSERD